MLPPHWLAAELLQSRTRSPTAVLRRLPCSGLSPAAATTSRSPAAWTRTPSSGALPVFPIWRGCQITCRRQAGPAVSCRLPATLHGSWARLPTAHDRRPFVAHVLTRCPAAPLSPPCPAHAQQLQAARPRARLPRRHLCPLRARQPGGAEGQGDQERWGTLRCAVQAALCRLRCACHAVHVTLCMSCMAWWGCMRLAVHHAGPSMQPRKASGTVRRAVHAAQVLMAGPI